MLFAVPSINVAHLTRQFNSRMNMVGADRVENKNHHEFEGGIKKPVLRITVWHHEACRVMTNRNDKGWIFSPTLHK